MIARYLIGYSRRPQGYILGEASGETSRYLHSPAPKDCFINSREIQLIVARLQGFAAKRLETMARIVLSNYKETYKSIAKTIGSYQCARLIQAIEDDEDGVKHLVSDYTGTVKVRNCRDIVEGTVIATLLDGIYPNEDTGNHVAIFVKKNSDGITVFDQYPGKEPGERPIRYKGAANARIEKTLPDGTKKRVLAMSNDGDFYYVVEV